MEINFVDNEIVYEVKEKNTLLIEYVIFIINKIKILRK